MIADHHEPTSFGYMFGTFYSTLEIPVKEGVDNWLLEGVIESEADQWFAGSGHGIDVEIDGKNPAR
jgi:hypothetical protein